MSDKPISGLPAGGPAQGTDNTVIQRGSLNYKLSAQDIANFSAANAPAQNANTYFSGPTSGSPAIPTFRLIDKLMNSSGTQISVDNFNYRLNDSAGNISANYSSRTTYGTNGNVAIDWNAKNLYDLSGTLSINWQVRTLNDPSGNVALNYQNRQSFDGVGALSTDWGFRQLRDTAGLVSVDWGARLLTDISALTSIDYQNRRLFLNDGSTLVVDYQNSWLFDASGNPSINWANREIFDDTGQQAIIYFSGSRFLKDGSSLTSIDWGNRQAIANDGSTQKINWNDPNATYFYSIQGIEFAVIPGSAPTVNYITVNGAPSGNGPVITFTGADSDVGGTYMAQGAGSHDFTSSTCTQLLLTNQANAVNGFQMNPSTSGNPIVLQPIGEANTSMLIQADGAGSVKIGAAALNYPNADGSSGYVMTTDGSANLSLQPVPFVAIPTTQIGVAGPTQMLSNNAYVATSSSPTAVFVLPVSPALGDIVEICGYGGSGWQVNIGTAAMLRIGNSAAISNIQSSSQWDCITLKCIQTASGGQWTVTSVIGNITIN